MNCVQTNDLVPICKSIETWLWATENTLIATTCNINTMDNIPLSP